MFAYILPTLVCGSCGYPLLNVDKQPYNVAKKKGVAQLICRHRECAEYDKPMECDLPQVELRATQDREILAQLEPPRLVVLNS